MKRFLGAVVVLLLVAAGAATAALGALGLVVFGTDGTYESTGRSVEAAPASVAIIADLTGVEIGIPFHQMLGEATLTMRSTDGSPLFLGQAEQTDVDAYLFGRPYDLATKNGSWTLIPVPGVETEVPPPQQADFWVQSASGVQPTLTLRSPGEPQTLVLMRADGSAGVAATITLGFSGERIGPASIAAVVGGLLLVVLSFAFVLYRRRKRRRSTREAANGAAGPRTSISEEQGDVVDLAAAGSGDPAGVAEAAAARPADDSVR